MSVCGDIRHKGVKYSLSVRFWGTKDSGAQMNPPARKHQNGKIDSTVVLGKIVSTQRKAQGLTQVELAMLGLVGPRFIGDLERGKGTVQCDKVLHVLNLLGLDVHVVERGT